MKGTFRLTKVLGIDIDIHITFFLLLGFFFLFFGIKGLVLIVGIFFFVTVHELCHSVVAAKFGIKVKRITLLPIGGVASMPEIPAKPYQELLISLAGPLSNILIVVVFYYPLYILLGEETLLYPLKVLTGQAKYAGQFNVIAHIYWINLVLAVFNMIPAFPMDGGRILRAVLSYSMDRRKATRIAVKLGHIFALIFAYFGIVYGNIFLLLIAVFVYMAATSEGLHVSVTETIKNYRVKDVLPEKYVYVNCRTSLAKILELVFHTHQEDYPVLEAGRLKGIVTRKEIIRAIHEKGKNVTADYIMRKDIPPVKVNEKLHIVQKMMQNYSTHAMPVRRNDEIV
ncbi:MAG: site-2 protease family protein, partial [Candidatus Omnitrophota bacterium]